MRQRKFFTTILAAFAMIPVLTAAAFATSPPKVLHKFKGGTDGGHPTATLIFDAAGDLYGTTREGGVNTMGTVFKLIPNSNGSWTESVLYRFAGGSDGEFPQAGLIFDGAGNLYGTTPDTVFRLKPNSDGTWTESVLYNFCQLNKCADGVGSDAGLVFDGAGNLYGTTSAGGTTNCGCGTVFKLTPNSDGSWTESVLYSFDAFHGADPGAGLIFDAAGNLYGTAIGGGQTCGNMSSCGLVFKLTPNMDGTWKEHVLYAFRGGKDGGAPYDSLTFDAAGNLYGTTSGVNDAGLGTVFKLAPKSHGGWKESVLHRFAKDTGANPYAGLTLDASGNLYGTAYYGGSANDGVVFKLAPRQGGGWAYSVLNVFQGNPGMNPYGGLVLDPAGNLYGTTLNCANGQKCRGIVFEVTP
jgi:uncharacterized repeat protein (TIGR03803 family)